MFTVAPSSLDVYGLETAPLQKLFLLRSPNPVPPSP